MNTLGRFRQSTHTIAISLFAVAWLALAPLVQAIGSRTDANGLPGNLVICTKLGIVTLKSSGSGENQDDNDGPGSSFCPVCSSLQLMSKTIAAEATSDIAVIQREAVHDFTQVHFGSNSPTCHLPRVRAPPSVQI